MSSPASPQSIVSSRVRALRCTPRRADDLWAARHARRPRNSSRHSSFGELVSDQVLELVGQQRKEHTSEPGPSTSVTLHMNSSRGAGRRRRGPARGGPPHAWPWRRPVPAVNLYQVARARLWLGHMITHPLEMDLQRTISAVWLRRLASNASRRRARQPTDSRYRGRARVSGSTRPANPTCGCQCSRSSVITNDPSLMYRRFLWQGAWRTTWI